MKLLYKVLSALVFVVSFAAALYLGYRLFSRQREESDYYFGDSMYDGEPDQDLYEDEVLPKSEEPVPESIEEVRSVNAMYH
ncbi:MAG: hypothetical protein A2527_04995 [Candidatus Lambdaproteobacteria bacterium RIFOXYD2_FULL_50_16]|uniref:Uncharacterized protein n=1 Tax=Candidatus Lambdaproteobacteria bacterium RIFOXYD2_FULL_50_16 TaxID=1817772 RepID=A0A1F6G821_9PROT|nr:MAG: hypothetical protein A2527_04995 [Candidatus Lambdaproteobacteria bacterium RIFOXYD2_FULL_50_16]